MKTLWILFKICYSVMLILLSVFCLATEFVPSLSEWVMPSGLDRLEGNVAKSLVPYVIPGWLILLTFLYTFIFNNKQDEE